MRALCNNNNNAVLLLVIVKARRSRTTRPVQFNNGFCCGSPLVCWQYSLVLIFDVSSIIVAQSDAFEKHLVSVLNENLSLRNNDQTAPLHCTAFCPYVMTDVVVRTKWGISRMVSPRVIKFYTRRIWRHHVLPVRKWAESLIRYVVICQVRWIGSWWSNGRGTVVLHAIHTDL